MSLSAARRCSCSTRPTRCSGRAPQISDAHDRYANLETAYLLQRLDHFEGLAVLATNLRHNIDPAFMRRMDSVVDFALPDLTRRRELWQLHLPPDRMAEDVDIDALARLYPVAGGWIRNAAITAAFFAAPGRRPDSPAPPGRRHAQGVPECGSAVPRRTPEETR